MFSSIFVSKKYAVLDINIYVSHRDSKQAIQKVKKFSDKLKKIGTAAPRNQSLSSSTSKKSDLLRLRFSSMPKRDPFGFPVVSEIMGIRDYTG